MENKKEINETELPTDVDQHDSPLKEAVLIDDSIVREDSYHLHFDKGIILVCKFVELDGEFFRFREKDTDILVTVNKHPSIIIALNKINFSPECELEINCIGDDKFKITKK